MGFGTASFPPIYICSNICEKNGFTCFVTKRFELNLRGAQREARRGMSFVFMCVSLSVWMYVSGRVPVSGWVNQESPPPLPPYLFSTHPPFLYLVAFPVFLIPVLHYRSISLWHFLFAQLFFFFFLHLGCSNLRVRGTSFFPTLIFTHLSPLFLFSSRVSLHPPPLSFCRGPSWDRYQKWSLPSWK